ncbi:MAG TPA: serine/threonine-protein kinase [Polyangiaceae bacterium]|nr:serine/threonine-protein kinase [Polyangiaceae bacterium]
MTSRARFRENDARDEPARASCALAPDQLVAGKYRIQARLADGGIGVVFRASHLELESPVAIKVVRSEHAQNEDVVTRLLSEARIAANLRSRHVNRVLDLGRTETGAPYLVLEYMDGCDLSSCLDRCGPLPPGEAVDYLMQACEALAEAHAIGIVHRDLKPANLFLSEEADGGFVLKVLDFGISKAPAAWSAVRRLTNPLEIVGSPNYMAPEQVRGENVDNRADIWALGVVLHELCSGAAPFDAPTLVEIFAQIVDERHMLPPLPSSDVSAALDSIIARCLQRNPDQRYQNVVELAEALARFGSDSEQAGRVARVASATRARMIAGREGDLSALEATPVAVALEQRQSPPLLPSPTRRSRTAIAAVVASLAVSSTVAAYVLRGAGRELVVPAATTQPELSRTPDLALPLPRTPELAPVAIAPAAAAPAPPEPIVKPSPAATVVRPAARHGLARPNAKRFVPPPMKTVAIPVAPVAVPVATVAIPAAGSEPSHEPASPPSPPEVNAWDPKNFGGRR